MVSQRPINVKGESQTCGAVTLGIVKQVAPAIGTGIANWLKGVLTVANITKCLNSTDEKIDDGLHRKKKGPCAPDPSSPSSGPVAGPGAPSFGHGGSKLTDPVPKAPSFVNYPSKFSNIPSTVNGPSKVPVNWSLTEKSSVAKRWVAQPRQPQLYST